MRVLLIEDEYHKQNELTGYLREYLALGEELSVVESVRSAIVEIGQNDYNLLVLDMALPTFSSDSANPDGGRDQALGGVEVLRALKHLGKNATIVIVTQYPDILVDGRREKLSSARKLLSRKYDQNIAGALLYKYKSNTNRTKLREILDVVWRK
jgi:CheY-like chemotaxis protein